MDKYAAEKIAQGYYTLGLQLAFEKVAGILDKSMAAMMAQNLGKEIGQAGKLTSEAGALRRLSGHIPGTKMHGAQKVLGGASGKANLQTAQEAHNLGFGRFLGDTPGAVRSLPGPTGGNYPRQRFLESVGEGTPSNYFPKKVRPLSRELRLQPSEEMLRTATKNIRENRLLVEAEQAARQRANYQDIQ